MTSVGRDRCLRNSAIAGKREPRTFDEPDRQSVRTSLTTTPVGLHGRWCYLVDDSATGHGGVYAACVVQLLTLNLGEPWRTPADMVRLEILQGAAEFSGSSVPQSRSRWLLITPKIGRDDPRFEVARSL